MKYGGNALFIAAMECEIFSSNRNMLKLTENLGFGLCENTYNPGIRDVFKLL